MTLNETMTATPPRRPARADLYAALVLLLAALALFLPYLLRPDVVMWPRSGLGSDLITYNWPPAQYIRQGWQAEGEIPLWWGTSMGGIPMIGNPGVRAFYPPLLLLILSPLPLSTAFALVNILQFWLAGLGTYALARSSLKLSPIAALFAGLAVLLMPRLSSNVVGDMGYTLGLCWVPLCIWLVRAALDRLSWRWTLAAGLALGWLYVLNFVFAIYLALFIGFYLLLCLVELRQQRRDPLRTLALLLLMGLVAIGAAAFHLLPFLTYLPEQARQSMTLADNNYLALPLPFLINIIIPTPFKFPEWEAYSGLLVLLLLPLAWKHPQRREAVIWFFMLLFSLLFALGTVTPFYSLILGLVPGFGLLRVPARMLQFAAIAAALLAALGLDTILNTRHVPLRGMSIAALLLGLLSITGRFLSQRPGEMDWMLGLLAGLGLLIALVALGLWQRARLTLTTLSRLLIAALLLDLFPLALSFAEARPIEDMLALPPIGEALQNATANEDQLFRIYSARRELADHLLVDQGWQAAEGLNSFQFEAYSRLMRQASGCRLDGIAAAVPPCASNEIDPEAYLDTLPDPALLGMLNVRYIISEVDYSALDSLEAVDTAGEAMLYRNTAALARAYTLTRVAGGPPLAALDLSTIRVSPADLATTVPATVLYYRANEVGLAVDQASDSLLVLADHWVPGWRVSVDDEPAPLLHVNDALRGVLLEPGAHKVVFRFLPPLFLVGLVLALLTPGLCILLWLWGVKQR